MVALARSSKRPPDSDFYQQRLKAWQPILTPNMVILLFLAVGIVFIPIGVLLKLTSDAVVEVSVQYGGDGSSQTNCHITRNNAGRTCSVSMTAPSAMTAPVYVYYQLDNFYQNHRRYVKSRSDSQLQGQILPASSLSDCDPLITNSSGAVLQPCGLIANSFFNDVITIKTPGVTMDETNISWESDRNTKFKAISLADQAKHPEIHFISESYPQIPASKGVTDEHFIVWMRTAALPTFRKLYGHIDKDIPANTVLNFTITNNFMVDSFNGKKTLVVSTTSWLGGKNPFLGYAYIVVGALCVLFAIVFFIKDRKDGRDLGDPQYLQWNVANS